MTVRVVVGDCREKLRELAGGSFDSCVTDPPYGLGFMGKRWDRGEIAFEPAFWAEVLRVLKPGGHLVAFGGTRTYHRLACAIEDGGFEIRDQLGWVYGSGFPKSHDVSKGIDRAAGVEREVISEGKAVKRMIPGADQNKRGWEKNDGREFVPTETVPATEAARRWAGWGTALKPAWEPICLARKPLVGTVAANVLEHGTGALNIGGCRVGNEVRLAAYTSLAPCHGNALGAAGTAESRRGTQGELKEYIGRWPANLVHDGSEEVLAAFPETQSGTFNGNRSADEFRNAYGVFKGTPEGEGHFEANSGSAACFFYCAKADDDDRLRSRHPTVKPVDLMAYLCRLVTPPRGLVLDPFAGSGTTGMACMREGFDCVLIEREAEYVADIERRLAHVSGADTPLFAQRCDDA